MKLDRTLTEQIDIVHIKNSAIHEFDYKLVPRRERPIVQLTLYALALSRLAGLPLYDCKCAWVNAKAYSEIFLLDVTYKLRRHAKKENRSQLKVATLLERGK